jgi:hypothetical protein
MQLNTKQVRALARNVTSVTAKYTDRTLADKTSKRRSVIWHFYNTQDAEMLANYLRRNCANKVTRTGVMADMWQHTSGGEYVRVIADLA